MEKAREPGQEKVFFWEPRGNLRATGDECWNEYILASKIQVRAYTRLRKLIGWWVTSANAKLQRKEGICGFSATLGHQCLRSERARKSVRWPPKNYKCLRIPLISNVLKSYFAPGGCSDRPPLQFHPHTPTQALRNTVSSCPPVVHVWHTNPSLYPYTHKFLISPTHFSHLRAKHSSSTIR